MILTGAKLSGDLDSTTVRVLLMGKVCGAGGPPSIGEFNGTGRNNSRSVFGAGGDFFSNELKKN